MKFKTTIPEIDPSKDASAGARPVSGKTNECDSVMTDAKVLKAEPEKVRDAVEVKNGARDAIDKQLRRDGIDGTSSSPKSRNQNYWGVGEKSIADAAKK